MADIQREVVSMRIPADLKARLQDAAALDHRSMTDLIIAVTTCWLDGRNYEPVQRLHGTRQRKAARSQAEYILPRGRPRAAKEDAREQYLIDALQQHFAPTDEATIEEMVAAVGPSKPVQYFDRSVENQLPHIGWIMATRASDGATVWLGPQHPFRVTE